jgi:protoporphyrinogen oxidase
MRTGVFVTARERTIAVIGGGVAGLSAARRLALGGLEPLVLEAGPAPGGRARSSEEAGAIFDLGAWTFPKGGAMHGLARAAGLESFLESIPVTVGRPARGRLKVADMRHPTSMAGSLIRLSESLAARRLQRMAREVPGASPDETAADWARRELPPGLVEGLLSPLANLFFLQSLDTLSRDALLGTVDYLARIELLSFQDGMGRLARSLAQEVPLRVDARVESLDADSGGVRLHGTNAPDAVRGVIVATPLAETARLLTSLLPREALETARNWPYAPALVVHMLLQGELPKAALQVLPPRDHNGVCGGLTMERAKGASRVPKGSDAVTMYARPERIPELRDADDEAVFQLFAQELRQWLSVPPDRVNQWLVTRWEHASAFCDPQTSKRQEILRLGLEAVSAAVPVWSAGDFLGEASLDGSVHSGTLAAEECLRALSG